MVSYVHLDSYRFYLKNNLDSKGVSGHADAARTVGADAAKTTGASGHRRTMATGVRTTGYGRTRPQVVAGPVNHGKLCKRSALEVATSSFSPAFADILAYISQDLY